MGKKQNSCVTETLLPTPNVRFRVQTNRSMVSSRAKWTKKGSRINEYMVIGWVPPTHTHTRSARAFKMPNSAATATRRNDGGCRLSDQDIVRNIPPASVSTRCYTPRSITLSRSRQNGKLSGRGTRAEPHPRPICVGRGFSKHFGPVASSCT